MKLKRKNFEAKKEKTLKLKKEKTLKLKKERTLKLRKVSFSDVNFSLFSFFVPLPNLNREYIIYYI